MDGQRRKRKVENEEESEEEKMEKFFDLIRSTREVRELIAGTTTVRPKDDGEKKTPNHKKAAGWKPSFQPQDFMVPSAQLKTINIHPRSLLPGPSRNKENENKVDKDLMVDGRWKTISIDQGSLLQGPSKKSEEKEEEKVKAGDGLDLDLKL